jgi:hypothetical protein
MKNGLYIKTYDRFANAVLKKMRYNYQREIKCKGKHRWRSSEVT